MLTLPVVLLTGFEPFGGDSVNPSALAVRALHGRSILGHPIVSALLPVTFDAACLAMDALLTTHRPALVITVGQAGGRAAVSLERLAINVDDARIADNAGAQPIDQPVVAGGPAAYFSTLPIKAMRAEILAAGMPADVSQTAGTFVCNHVFYGLMHRLATDEELKATRGGCIHVPWLPEQGTPALALEDTIRALDLAIQTALSHSGDDLSVTAGATH
ncbi:MAG: pyroglutamyl-peptidase I [Rubrivivax sp.]|nr:MAG: pyroglutamyl-peptidase I [Rubrivivax sp.]